MRRHILKINCFAGPIARVVLISLILFSVPNNIQAASIDVRTQVALQMVLRDYISNKTGAKKYTFFDDVKGTSQTLILRRIHPVIFKKNDRFLMCADFIDEEGKDFLVDYIISHYVDGYRVEKEIEGRRDFLTRLFEKVF